ncbi:MAG: serine/threonine-protein kinase [Kofleriaceae bacterium]
MEEPLQKSLERYDVLDRIAVGGMAEVFIAKAYGAHGFEKTLAIKRILPELARDPEFEARFIAEAKVAVRLSHANIVQVFDFGRIGESLFIAMEFVDGLDLAAMLRKFRDEGRHIPLPAAFHIAIEIVRALDFAHGHNVVHRDVSPSNILISRAGEVKIADFGIAVAAQPHRNSAPGPKRVMGKWRYMSPEQTRGDTLDTRSDLFSAASVIYELFTNEKLFPGDEAEDIIKNIADMAIPRMSALRPGLPSRLDEVLAGPLARKPIDRPTRPATVLRSLIELSSASSIRPPALDGGEALTTGTPAKRAPGRGALDDVIRKQLADQSVARQTAVTSNRPPSTETKGGNGEVSTGLFRKIDIDGLSRLEEVEAHTRVASGRGKRAATGSEPGGGHDPDRHTEVGEPPTGAVPKQVAEGTPRSSARLPVARAQAPRRALWLGLVAAVVAGGGAGAWAIWSMTRGEPPRRVDVPIQLPTRDAAEIEELGVLEIDSIPSGAAITIAGKAVGAAPRSAKVTSGEKVRVRFDLAGYLPFEEDYIAQPGKVSVIKERLSPAPAIAKIESVPSGAQVQIGGQSVGITPLSWPLAAGRGVEVRLSKPGYEAAVVAADFVAGETTAIKRELKESQKFGSVSFTVEGATMWAEIYVGGKNYGRNRTLSGLKAIRLPVGRQQVRLRGGHGKDEVVTVDVSERGAQTIAVKFE